MSKEETKKYCMGCEQNFYNGNNPYGVTECWNLSDAKIVSKKKVHRDQRPPWTQSPTKVLSCFQQNGYVFVGSDRTR